MKYLEDMTVRELKDYTLGLYAIPNEDFTGLDRENLHEVKAELLKHSVDVVFKSNDDIRFRKVA